MSTSTPIEIVRRYTQWREDGLARPRECPLEMGEVTIALASVLADAERLQTLDLWYKKVDGLDVRLWSEGEGRWVCHGGTLAELADRLKGTQ